LFTSVESFRLLSFATGIEAFARAACGIVLVLWGFQSLGALLGSALGASALFIFLLSKRNNIISLYNLRKQQGSPDNSLHKITALAFFVTVPTGFFLELDVLLAKRFFLPEDAGIYAAAALVGKGLLLFSTLASAVVYPKLVEEKLNRKGMSAFLWGIGITIFLFVSGYLFLLVFGKPLVGLLFGDKFSGVIGLVPLYTLAVIPLAIHLQIASFKSAIGGWTEGIWLWFLLAGYYLTLEMFSSTFHSYMQAIFIFHLLAAPVSFIVLYLKNRITDNKPRVSTP
jgi:O-antigen/teichoic acid export membrane protein